MSEINVTFTQNVKLGKNRYKKDENIKVSLEDCKALIESEVIEPIDDSLLIEPDPVNLFALSKEELDKINKPVIAAFLDKEGIEYSSKDTKDDLIKLITGGPDEEPEQNE